MAVVQQMKVLMWKNMLLMMRNWKLTFMQLGCPILFVFLLFLMGEIPKYGGPIGNQYPVDITRIPVCTPRTKKDRCFTFMFAPANDSVALEIVSSIASVQNLDIYIYSDSSFPDIPNGAVVGMNTFAELEQFIILNQNFTQSVLFFNSSDSIDFLSVGLSSPSPSPSPSPSSSSFLSYRNTWQVKYEIWYNSTCTNVLLNPSVDLSVYTDPVPQCPDIRPQLQLATDCAITKYLLGNSTANVSCSGQAQSYYWADLGVDDTVQTYGVLFFFCAMMFVFVVLIYQVVFEKDKNLKLGMQLMGLKESVFWLTWFFTSLIVSFVAVMLVMTTGYILQFAFFWETNFFINFFNFFFFSVAMIGLSLFVSVIVSSAKQAISIGMALYIVGVLIQIFLQNKSFVAFIYSKDMLVANILRPFFFCYPPFNFAKLVTDVSAKSYNLGGSKGPGYTWADVTKKNSFTSNGVGDDSPADIWSWFWLFMDCVIYYTLAWYLSNVLPSDTSSGSPPWFFLTPQYWGFSKKKQDSSYHKMKDEDRAEGSSGRVTKRENSFFEESSLRAGDAVQIIDVRKIHYKYPFGIRSDSDVLAVDGLNLTIKEGELFCLLGHNGAGKTTTINMLTGLYPPTTGRILVFDEDIEADLESVRARIGICPQHDILWLEMTAEEHLYLFSQLKGLGPEETANTIEETLNHVNLAYVRSNPASSFSGGMKRRLSVAISSIGNPSVIFMDEPTTGMDPKSRRQVWKMIEDLKVGRVIIMTTHSMEEAEMLADRLGIMARGKMKCYGTSLFLKNNYGKGYRLTVLTDGDRVEEVKAIVAARLPKAEILTVSGGQISFSLHMCPVETIVAMIRFLESRSIECSAFLDWGITQAGLEEVFLTVTGHGTANKSNVIEYDE